MGHPVGEFRSVVGAQVSKVRKILLANVGLVQEKRRTGACRQVRNPTIGRSTSRRRMKSLFTARSPQSGQVSATSTGSALMTVRVPASTASVTVRPSSAVRQMISETRLPVGSTLESWFGQMKASQLSSSTGQTSI